MDPVSLRTHLDFSLEKRAEFRKMVVNIFNIRCRARAIAFIFLVTESVGLEPHLDFFANT